jgi:hypothetical protein
MGYVIKWEEREIVFDSKKVKFDDVLLATLELIKSEQNWFR